ncbi:DUF1542 domain-containing protein [Companilactobacillus musae]|uniref:DUF1542 domain-containing protein n=1 Tax=Companilactobacillus musae TaxID=1903258 RepID=UPI000E64647B|nr:DUF1542 domain-containing protein [Companilactobacillus musae]
MSYDSSGNVTNRKILTTSPQLLGFGNYVYGSLINNNGSYHIDGSGKASLKVLRAVYLSNVNTDAFVDQWYGMTAKNSSNFMLPKETKITINYKDASNGNKVIFSKNIQEYSGQNYSVSADKTLPGYIFSKAENESGYIGLSPVTVNYYFNKVSLSDLKQNASDAIDKEAARIKDLISNDGSLSAAEKATQSSNVDKDASTAKDNINKATNSDEVANAQSNGIATIDADHKTGNLDTIKQNANDVIDQKAKEVKDTISKDNTLTADQKAIQSANVDKDAAAAKENISKATTADDINKAENAGLGAIDADHITGNITSSKQASKDIIDAKAAKVKADIAADNTLSASEKASQTANVDKDAVAAKENISKATTADDIYKAENAGVAAIDADHVTGDLEASKKNAINSIDEKAAKIKSMISNDSTLTSDEKNTQMASVDKDAQNAKDNINVATTVDDISYAENAGLDAIDADHVAGNLDDIKNKALEAIAEKLSNVTDAISKDNTLTADEKAEQISKVNDDAKSARNNINSANSADKVSSAQNAGIAAIDTDYVPNDLDAIKNRAQDSIDERAVKVKDMILNDNSLSSDEKSVQIKNVEEDATKAKEKIANAQNSDEILRSESEGLSAIDTDYLPGDLKAAKDKANDAIDYQAQVTKNAISEDKTLTSSEKSKQMDDVDSDATKAKKAINEANDLDTVSSAEKSGLAAIDADHITNTNYGNGGSNGGANTPVEQNKTIDLTQTVAVPSNVKMVELFNISNNKVTRDKTRALGYDSCWFSDKVININGTSYLRVATNEWAKASDVYRYVSLDATLYTNKDARLINAQGETIANRGLAHDTAWHTDRIAYLEKDANTSQSNNNLRKYFRVATNEFVSATDVYIK